ncbi:SHOCT-like domain-containing protein [Alicyclobacillus acidiphilus]|uniref:SHOCT-like domain-containing protein n=1 Tax=Alicyclobacillus acidiphilus TaxID=182455 RepID=UPI0008363EC0|nr:DUF4097 family beta strand repeat-containing protein [Alicyclobacillus acidiphilus]
MEERMKILQLVAEGKLTPEQADMLLDALDNKQSPKNDSKMAWDRATDELKSLGTQMSSALMQGLSELRRGLEVNLSNLTFGETVNASVEHEFPAGIDTLHVTTTNARVRLEHWTQPFVRVYVHADVRVEEPHRAKEELQAAVVTSAVDGQAILELRTNTERAKIGSSRIDVYLPDSMRTVTVKSRNGATFADHIEVQELSLDTVNGQLRLDHTKCVTMRLTTQNGSIHLFNALCDEARDLFATSRNGAIHVNGLPSSIPIQGTAKTINGNVQVVHPSLTVLYDRDDRKNHCTFERGQMGDEVNGLSVYLETKVGKITVQ